MDEQPSVASGSRFGRAWLGSEPRPAPFLARLDAYPWLVVATTCLGAFAGQVDASIVQLGLPALEVAFDAPLDQVSWVAIAYSLSFTAALPVFARLAELAGRKLMYLLGFALFGLFSTLCGFAESLPWLIVFRVLQGVSGALLGANSLVILVAAAGPDRRGRALGLFAAAQAIGVSAGPALGGMLLDGLGWHWIFWVTVPVALAGAVLGWLVVPVGARLSRDTGFDWPAALLLIPALVGTMILLAKLSASGALSSWPVLVAIGGALFLALFILRERRTPSPLLDIGLFRSRAFSGGTIAVLLSYAMLYGMFLALSFALVRGYHDTPLAAGLRLTIVPVALGLVAPFSGGLAQRAPGVAMVGGMVGGMALCAAAALAIAWVLTDDRDGRAVLMVALAAYGAGLGLFIAPNNSATLAAAPAERAGQAGGLLNLMRAFGTATGVAAASTLLSWRLEAAAGAGGRTLAVSEQALLAAAGDVMLLLAAMAAIAGTLSLLRDAAGDARASAP